MGRGSLEVILDGTKCGGVREGFPQAWVREMILALASCGTGFQPVGIRSVATASRWLNVRVDLQQKLEAAVKRRAALLSDPATTACRLFHSDGDGIAGLVIERFGDVLIAQLHEERLAASEADVLALLEWLCGRLGLRAVYRKVFVRDRAKASADVEALHVDPRPWIGEPVDPELTILENGIRFHIRPYDGFSVGLFLEHRDNRRRVCELAAGRRVLNTFSYTCGFSVAAARGGAVSVDSVDVHKRYLEWGKRNFEANGLDLTPHRFFCSDVMDFYRRAARQGRRYDLVILDPPTFARLRRPERTFVLDEQLGDLCRGAIELLDPGGIILLATNHRQIPPARMEEELFNAAGERVCTITDRPALPTDFCGDPDYAKTVFARIG